MIRTHGLSLKRSRRQILQDVSIEIPAGVTAILGPNGAGKTTLLRCLLGVIKPSSGEVELGCETSSVGYLPQTYGVMTRLTVGEALRYHALLKRIPGSQIADAVSMAMKRLALEAETNTLLDRLSSGTARRVGIAAAALGDPDILVLDEPTAGLDPEERLRFRQFVRGTGGSTVVLSTHIVEDVVAVADRAIIIDRGMVLEQGDLAEITSAAEGLAYVVPTEIYNQHSSLYYHVGSRVTDGQELPLVLSRQPLDGLIPCEPTLEDGYLAIIKGLR